MIPNEIWVTNITPKVDAIGAALENQSLDINTKKITVKIRATDLAHESKIIDLIDLWQQKKMTRCSMALWLRDRLDFCQ